MPAPAVTATGSLPIGLRQNASAWQHERAEFARWAAVHGFAHLDPTGLATPGDIRAVSAAGVGVGTVDLLDWQHLLSADAQTRWAAVERNVAHLRSLAVDGVTTFFAVAAPADPTLAREENFGFAVESYRALCRAAQEAGARVALEGAPGKPPRFATIGCTPADLRALLAAVDSPALGINFDPSHPVRMGIDPLRMLREFAPRVFHVHAKDTIVPADAVYEHGHLQQATFARPHKFGAYAWRYALAGRGKLPWSEMLAVLRDTRYAGRISIELEDEDVEGEEAERTALLAARDFLRSV